MQIEYTPEDIRTLLDEHETLEYASATDADIAEAADVLEGIEELVGKLDPAVRRDELVSSSLPAGDHLWIPVARNCSRAAGVAIDPDGALSFMVTGHEGFTGDDFPTYFSARQAAAHALLGATGGEAEAPAEVPPEISPETVSEPADEDAIVAALKAKGWAVAAGRTLADIDPKVLAALYPLSEAGVAHLFAEGGGIVLAMAGSTSGDRRRAAERLAVLPGRRYPSRAASVLFECAEAGGHYSEESWFGHSLKEAPQSPQAELDASAERFRAARFVRPSRERPIDVGAVRRRLRRYALVRAAVRHALAVDAADAAETLRRLAALLLVARHFSRMIVRRALAAERPWDSEAERTRLEQAGARLRREIIAGRKARGGKPVAVTPTAALDAERRERIAPSQEDPKLRRSIDRRRESGRAAYDTARTVYLQRCPELEHKLLHLLRRDHAQPESEFVSRRRRLAVDASSPEAAIRAALRALAEAGKVRRVRSRKSGEVFVAATEPLDETSYRRSLNALIRDEGYGIVNPWAEAGSYRPTEFGDDANGDATEWERGTEDLEASEMDRLAPRRLRDTTSYEQPLPAPDLVAEPAAQEEIDAIA